MNDVKILSEGEAIDKINSILATLDKEAQDRVLNWACDKFGIDEKDLPMDPMKAAVIQLLPKLFGGFSGGCPIPMGDFLGGGYGPPPPQTPHDDDGDEWKKGKPKK